MLDFDVVIIGTGSGNSILTEEFESWRVAIVERGVFGGTCLNVGCIPSKMFVLPADRVVEAQQGAALGVDIDVRGVDWAAVRDRTFGRIDPIAADGTRYRQSQDHVSVFLGDARFTGDHELSVEMPDASTAVLRSPRFVLAAGARPLVPDIPGLAGTPFHTSDTIMRIEEPPEHLIVLGGGFIAAELGHVIAALGSRVTVVHRGDAMLRHEDIEVSQRFTEQFGQRVELRLETTPTAVRHEDGTFHLDLVSSTGRAEDEGVVSGDALLVAVGRIPNGRQLQVEHTGVTLDPYGYVVTDDTLATSVEGIWALGDIRNPKQLKHLANREAKVVSHNLLHPSDPLRIDERVVPHAVFSHPQIGSSGATEQDLVAEGRPHVVGRCDYGGVAYGWALEDSTGFAKVLVDPDNLQLLGAHVIGPQAATLVQQLVQAMQFEIPVDRLAREQIWAHPALPEVLENALLDALNRIEGN